MDLAAAKAQLIEWVSVFKYFPDRNVIDKWLYQKGDTLFMRIYTDTNDYQIVAKVRPDGSAYLGCQAGGRKPRAGCKYAGGNDLPDGEFSFETWHRILCGIVGYEMVKLHQPVSEIYRERDIDLKMLDVWHKFQEGELIVDPDRPPKPTLDEFAAKLDEETGGSGGE